MSVDAPVPEAPGFVRSRVAVIDVVGFVVVVGAIAGFLPRVVSPWWVPRVTVALLTLPLGGALLARRAYERDKASIAAIGYLAWTLIVSLRAPAPLISILGAAGRPNSALFVSGALAAWAIGREMTTDGRRMLPWAVVLCGATSAFVAAVQLIEQPANTALGLDRGRPVGLAAFAIYFSAHMAVCAVMFAYSFRSNRSWWAASGYAVSVFLVALGGSRVAMLAACLLAALMFVGRWRVVAAVVFTTGAAIALAATISDATGRGHTVGQRLGSQGIGDRLGVWKFGLESWTDRPFTGWGVGQFRTATQPRLTDSWVIRFWNDSVHVWRDAHNIVIEHLVGVGLIGLALFVVFLGVAINGCGGVCAWMASALAFGWLLEPFGPQTFALAGVLLGASSPAFGVDKGRALSGVLAGSMVAVGVAVAASFVAATFSIGATFDSPRVTDSDGIELWYAHDPVVARTYAVRNAALSTAPGDEAERASLEWLRRAAEREPEFTLWWTDLASELRRDGDFDGATSAAERALKLQPNHPVALAIMVGIASDRGDEQTADRYADELCRVGVSDFCSEQTQP